MNLFSVWKEKYFFFKDDKTKRNETKQYAAIYLCIYKKKKDVERIRVKIIHSGVKYIFIVVEQS